MTSAKQLLILTTTSGFYIALTLGSIIIYSRWLTPLEYAPFLACQILISLTYSFFSLGSGYALIRSKSPLDTLLVSVLMQQTGIMALASLILLSIANAYQSLTGVDEVAKYLKIGTTVLFFMAWAGAFESVILKSGRALTVLYVNNIAYFASYYVIGTSALILGMKGYSLLLAIASNQILRLLMLFVYTKTLGYKVGDPTVKAMSVLADWRYRIRLTFTLMLNSAALQIDNLLVSVFFGPAAMSIYSRAYNLQNLPAAVAGEVAVKHLYPRMVNSNEFGRLWIEQSLVFCLSMLLVPVFYFLAPQIISVLLGPDWSATANVIIILCFAIPFRVSQKLYDEGIKAIGRTDLSMLTQLIYALAVGVAVYSQAAGTLSDVCWAVVIANIVHLVSLHLSFRYAAMRTGRRLVSAPAWTTIPMAFYCVFLGALLLT